MRAKGLTSTINFLAFGAAIVSAVLIVKTNHAWHKDAITNDTACLLELVSDWNKAGQPSDQVMTNLIAKHGSRRTVRQPYVFTNLVEIHGTNYHCSFGISDPWFWKDEALVVTPERVVIWISKEGKKIVYPLVNKSN